MPRPKVSWDVQYRRLSPSKCQRLSTANPLSLAFTSSCSFVVPITLATTEEMWVVCGKPL